MKRTYIYDDKLKKVVELNRSHSYHSSPLVINNTYFAPDGSRLEKPMSTTYINHIRSRNSESIKRMKPNMGAYGA